MDWIELQMLPFRIRLIYHLYRLHIQQSIVIVGAAKLSEYVRIFNLLFYLEFQDK